MLLRLLRFHMVSHFWGSALASLRPQGFFQGFLMGVWGWECFNDEQQAETQKQPLL